MQAAVYKRTPRTIARKYHEYFLPTILNFMAQNLALTVDSVIAGNILGTEALSAISVLSPVTQLYAALVTMLGVGVSVTVSGAKGQNDPAKANRIYTVGMLFAAGASALLMAVQLPLIDVISGALAGETNLKDTIAAYYLPFVLATPVNLFFNLFVNVLRSDGRPKFSAALVIIANGVNLGADLLYMGVLGMNITGSAVATTTGQIFAALIMLSHFTGKKSTLHADKKVFKNKRNALSALKEFLGTGFASALGELLLVIKLEFVIVLVQKCAGDAGAAAFSVYLNVLMVVSLFIGGGAEAMLPIVGMCMGEHDNSGVKYALKQAFRILLISSAAISAVIMIIPGNIAGLFGISGTAELECCAEALRITAPSFIGVSVSFLMLYYYSAVGREKFSVLISIMNTVGFVIPSALLMSGIWGIDGVWYSFIASEVLTIIFIAVSVLIISKRSGGDASGLYLLPKDENTALSLSFEANDQNAAGVAKYICDELGDNKTAVAVEDITAHLAQKSPDILIDVRIIKGERNIVSVRYTGKPYDPLLEEDDDIVSAVNVVKALTENIEYSTVLGFNRLTMTIPDGRSMKNE